MLNLLKYIKQSCPWIWYVIEYFNGLLIKLFYGQRIKLAVQDALSAKDVILYEYRQLQPEDTGILLELISNQPVGFDKYFSPHPFDFKNFQRVLSNGTFVLIGAFDNNDLVGYCFIRFFVNKSAFRGKIVDYKYQGRGIAKQMGQIMTNIASEAGFRVYATISKSNVASLQSAKAGSKIEVIKELPDNYLYIEILKDPNYVS